MYRQYRGHAQPTAERPGSSLSALPLKADKEQTCWYVRFVPKADACTATNEVHGRDDLQEHGFKEQIFGANKQVAVAPSPGTRFTDENWNCGRGDWDKLTLSIHRALVSAVVKLGPARGAGPFSRDSS